MKKIILDVAVSIDGLIEGPNGEYDWCFSDQDYGLTDFLNSVDAVFYGRKSYELFGMQIPDTVTTDKEKEFWDLILSKKKYVFSTKLKTVDNETTLISENIEEEVNKIKVQPGKDIWLYGGASLVTTFVNLGLVDEFRLAVHPIILGAGKPLFIEIKKRIGLELIDTKVFSSGLVFLRYKLDKK
jgi:dihydrofolate reductase